jgi:multicomponent Na+:H+ antiporter subunit F
MFTLFETIVLCILGTALLLATVRLLRGPSVPDRILALDVLSMIAIGILGLYATAIGDPALLDVAIGIAVIAFLATAGLAHYYLTHSESASEAEKSVKKKSSNRKADGA